ncbi:MAG: hypothetical protein PHU44_12640 [Syntrophales bacterium]|nr:hypothetical protein [Syntrophales bacterium]MDD5641379.1 hypothetical protein [Syntrophales bacterium]
MLPKNKDEWGTLLPAVSRHPHRPLAIRNLQNQVRIDCEYFCPGP